MLLCFEKVATSSLSTPTSLKFAKYFNFEFGVAFLVLVALLKGPPEPEPADCLYEESTIYWE